MYTDCRFRPGRSKKQVLLSTRVVRWIVSLWQEVLFSLRESLRSVLLVDCFFFGCWWLLSKNVRWWIVSSQILVRVVWVGLFGWMKTTPTNQPKWLHQTPTPRVRRKTLKILRDVNEFLLILLRGFFGGWHSGKECIGLPAATIQSTTEMIPLLVDTCACPWRLWASYVIDWCQPRFRSTLWWCHSTQNLALCTLHYLAGAS